MLDLKFLRENPEIVKQNIRNKFQDNKLPLVDEVIALDAESRKTQQEADNLRADRKRISKEIGALMGGFGCFGKKTTHGQNLDGLKIRETPRIRLTTMTKNEGKIFEAIIKSNAPSYLKLTRIPDPPQSFTQRSDTRFSKKNPYDFAISSWSLSKA